jgi:hypothetical protein
VKLEDFKDDREFQDFKNSLVGNIRKSLDNMWDSGYRYGLIKGSIITSIVWLVCMVVFK